MEVKSFILGWTSKTQNFICLSKEFRDLKFDVVDFAGPGCSSVGAGAFVEHGPFKPKGNVLLKNEYSWNKGNHLLVLGDFLFVPSYRLFSLISIVSN